MRYDVLVIGAGPGGYVAAIRSAQLGMKTAIVEKYDTLGGTCLNVGCIPSKALLDSSEHYYNAKAHFSAHGIKVQSLGLDFPKMMARKHNLVSQICKGVSFLMKKNNIAVYHGLAFFINANTIGVKRETGGVEEIKGDNIIIATGSKPSTLPFVPLDGERIITSTEALVLPEVPKHMVVIGGGVIGMELGSVYARLGAKVSVVEYLNSLIPTMDSALGKELEKVATALGFSLYLRHKVVGVSRKGKVVQVDAIDTRSGKDKAVSIQGDYCLLSIGRSPYTAGLGLENIGLSVDKHGRLPVDEQLRTTVPNVYAIGDVVRGPMLAHKAEEEGVFVAEHISGQRPHIHYLLIPNVVYTWPEVAGVGYTEEQLKERGLAYKVGTFPFKALGRAKASGDEAGLVKILADAATDELLGMHVIGARAADLIAEGVVAMEYKASAEDVARMSHAHPTYTEAIKEACLAATARRPLHL